MKCMNKIHENCNLKIDILKHGYIMKKVLK
jgi:hypothetical protein